MTAQTTQVRFWQKLAAGVASCVAAFSLYTLARNDTWKVSIALVALVAAAFLVHRATLGPQLVARAVWWANLGLGTAFCVFGGRSERGEGLVLALACGAALLVTGRKGLAEASERAGYAPAAFRSSLLLMMALALADAQTFLLFGILMLTGSHSEAPSGMVLAIVGALFVVGFVGLYRLWLWGAFLNVVTALAFGIILLTHAVQFDRELRLIFLTLCAGQLLAAAPMTIGLVRGKPLPSAPAALRGAGATFVVAALMLLCACLTVTR